MTLIISLIMGMFGQQIGDAVIPKAPRYHGTITCGMTPGNLEDIQGDADAEYSCYDFKTLQYDGKLFAFYKNRLAGTVPLHNYYEECMDPRSLVGFRSECKRKAIK